MTPTPSPYLRITTDGGKMLKGQIALTATRPTNPAVSGGQPTGDLARGKAASASGYTQVYAPGNAVDGDAGTYWESVNNAFPQWFQVDLGAVRTVSRLVMKLPPSWGARVQTLAVSGSTDGSGFTVNWVADATTSSGTTTTTTTTTTG